LNNTKKRGIDELDNKSNLARYGIVVEEGSKEEEDSKKLDRTCWNFFSEFIGSFAGWCFFYVFVFRVSNYINDFRTADAILAIGAVVGIAGYSYSIARNTENLIYNRLNKKTKLAQIPLKDHKK
jgi:hypothetical protein